MLIEFYSIILSQLEILCGRSERDVVKLRAAAIKRSVKVLEKILEAKNQKKQLREQECIRMRLKAIQQAYDHHILLSREERVVLPPLYIYDVMEQLRFSSVTRCEDDDVTLRSDIPMMKYIIWYSIRIASAEERLLDPCMEMRKRRLKKEQERRYRRGKKRQRGQNYLEGGKIELC